MSPLAALSLALGPALGWASPPAVTATAPQDDVRASERYEALEREFEAAVDRWRQARREAEDAAERRRLRKAHPAREFWSRFEALAAEGEGRAELWMVEHLRDKGLRSSEVRAEKPVRYARLVERYAGAEWFDQVLERLDRDERYLGTETVRAAYERVIEVNRHPEVRAAAMHHLAMMLLDSEDPESREEGERWLARLAEELPDTEYGARAADGLFIAKHLRVGCVAPDFEAKTIDGHAFRLSDYRGKVVMLDFYGFW